MTIYMGGLVSGILSVCIGNAVWLAGFLVLLVGVWGLKVKKESIMKAVNMMSLATGGQAQGFALKLKGLVEPEDRTDEFGKRMLIIGIVLLIVGSAFITRCAG